MGFKLRLGALIHNQGRSVCLQKILKLVRIMMKMKAESWRSKGEGYIWNIIEFSRRGWSYCTKCTKYVVYSAIIYSTHSVNERECITCAYIFTLNNVFHLFVCLYCEPPTNYCLTYKKGHQEEVWKVSSGLKWWYIPKCLNVCAVLCGVDFNKLPCHFNSS